MFETIQFNLNGKPVKIDVLKHAIEGAFEKIHQRQGRAANTPL